MTERYGGESRAAKKFVEKVAPETERTPERAETWTPEQLEKRHHIATLAMQMDTAMRGTPEDRARFEQELEQAPISEKLRRTFYNVATGYMTMCANTKDTEIRLRGSAESAEDFGTRLFQFRTLTNPKGIVTAERYEGYFVVTCASSEDYAKFREPNSARIAESLGAYHRSLPLNAGLGFSTIDAIIINGTQNVSELRRTVDHERQHWINHQVLAEFGWVERAGTTPRDILMNPKDEILAYLRDGTSSHGIDNALRQRGSYNRYWETHNATRQETMTSVTPAIHDAESAFPPPMRVTLVTQLYDVPCDELPGAIRKLTLYYRERRDVALHAIGLSREEFDRASVAIELIHPRQLRNEQLHLQASYNALMETGILARVYGTDGVYIPTDALADTNAETKAAGERLRHALLALETRRSTEGTPLPTIELHGIPKDASHRRAAERLAETIIDVACTIPQATIDRAIERGEKGLNHHVAVHEDTLARSFEKMLRTHTGMQYDVTISPPLEVYITQRATDLLPEITYALNLHHSI